MKIYESFGTNTDVTGKFDVEPFEYEYTGNFEEIERTLQHFKENGFDEVITGGAAFDDDGEKLWDETNLRDPFPGEKRHQIKREIRKRVDAPDGQRIQIR